MANLPAHWKNKLQERTEQNALRELKIIHGLVDFYSNDYIGLANDPELMKLVNMTISGQKEVLNGSTGSRLLSGNHIWARRCEYYLSEFYQSPEAILFNSGYDANSGIMACIAGREDTIIYDELVHASIRDGIRLSISRNFSFRHNDTDDLEKKLRQASGEKFIITESVFSMDGDEAPLMEILKLCEKFNARLIVDEAHAIGIWGDKGQGKASQLGITEQIFIRIVTFGKGAGVHGAAALCADDTKKYLVNFCRPFIYSTALPPVDCIAIMTAHELMQDKHSERVSLHANITQFRELLRNLKVSFIEGSSPIVPIIIPGNNKVKEISMLAKEEGLGIFPVLSPTVPVGTERLRIIIHSYNSSEEIQQLVQFLNTVLNE